MNEEPMRDSISVIDSFEMGKGGIIVFVEGFDFDPYTYENLICKARKTDEEVNVVKIEEIDLTALGMQRNASGKPTCLSYLKYLKLNDELKSKDGQYYTLFCLDKDIDDLKNNLVDNPHVVYTPTYDIEAYCCININLDEVIKSILCIDSRTFSTMPNRITWNYIGEFWLWWNTYCIVNDTFSLGETGYSSYPKMVAGSINEDLDFVMKKITMIMVKLFIIGYTSKNIEDIFTTSYYISKNLGYKSVFKGKWLIYLLTRALDTDSKGIICDTHALGSRVPQAIKTSFGPSAVAWPELKLALWIGEEFLIAE